MRTIVVNLMSAAALLGPTWTMAWSVQQNHGEAKAGCLKAVQVSSSSSATRRASWGQRPSLASPPWAIRPSSQQQQQRLLSSSLLSDFWMPVLSSAMLVTGNTFGAGSLVLPALVAEPGLGPSIGIFGVAYLLNLISGLTLANVAITQYDESSSSRLENDDDVPSSFQEFVQANLQSPELAMLMSVVSFGVNSLVLAFDISRVGFLFQGSSSSDSMMMMMTASALWSAGLVALTATLTQEKMSRAASVCVMVLFASFGSLLLPGLASLTNPLADLWTPGTFEFGTGAFYHSISEIAPVILMCTIFQNIVPTIVKLQNYDRTKSFTAIVLGSFLPLAMYVAWCWACLGQGGIDLDSAAAAANTSSGGPLLFIFSLATLAGSSIGCSLSCASELDIFVKKIWGGTNSQSSVATTAIRDNDTAEDNNNDRFQLVSVLATVGLPFALVASVAHGGGGDLTSALHAAGALGGPLLYGVIPALMAIKQMQKQQESNNRKNNKNMTRSEMVGLGLFGMASAGMFCENLMDYASLAWITATAEVAQVASMTAA